MENDYVAQCDDPDFNRDRDLDPDFVGQRFNEACEDLRADEAESEDRNAPDFADEDDCEDDDFDDAMDGDHESALASAGFGTDEDYGSCSSDGEDF